MRRTETIGRLALSVLAAMPLAAPWSALAAEYVVDQSHARASDENPGTANAPFKTISRGVSTARPGDTVLVKAGTYPERVKIASSGVQGRPITLEAASGERVIVGGPEGPGSITWANGVGYWVIDGFRISHGGGMTSVTGAGSADAGGHHITVQNCVFSGVGVRLNGCSDCAIRRCIQTGCSRNGVQLRGCKNCVVEECEIFSNGADGLTILGGSDGCRISRNYIHDHWYASHPDALQLFAGVTNIVVEGNLLFNSGQGFMMEQTDGGVFRNNMLVGTHHSGLLLGHANSHNWDIDGNTIAYTAFQALVFSGQGTRVRNNIILTGGDNKLLSRAGKWPCQADYNLYWRAEGDVRYDVTEDQDTHSKFADPKLRSAPPLLRQAVFYVDKWADQEAPAKCTTGRLCIGRKQMSRHFEVGDHVEVNFDGVVRKVTDVTDDSIAFVPPLATLHHLPWDVVVNWKDSAEFVWDLRLADDSPAKGMGEDGRDVGSSIDIQAYMRGDFDGDGERDLPTFAAQPARK